MKIAGGDAVPPTGVGFEPQLTGNFLQDPFFIMKHPDRSPFASKHQIRITVAVQIAEHRSTDHANALEWAAVPVIQLPLAGTIVEQF